MAQAQTVEPRRTKRSAGSKMPSAKAVSLATINALKPRGNTALRDFGRNLRNEPHKYIFTLKLFMCSHNVPLKPMMDFLRERYISSQSDDTETGNSTHHGTRYEVRSYTGKDDQQYVNYILLESLTEDERDMLILNFGEVTSERIERDGKPRRLRLTKEERHDLDDIIDAYYLEIERERLAAQ